MGLVLQRRKSKAYPIDGRAADTLLRDPFTHHIQYSD